MKRKQPTRQLTPNLAPDYTPVKVTHGFPPLRTQIILLSLLTVVFYFNSIISLPSLLEGKVAFHQYALDDGLVIGENPDTKAGIAGIPNLLTHDAYYAYYKSLNAEEALAGGRYRPLSIITFAIAYEFFGLSPGLSHAINVLLYGLTAILLLWLLRAYVLKNDLAAFAGALIFLIHPIHTEAIANIKSRDEIMSLLFLLLTLIYLFRSVYSTSRPAMLWSGLFYFLALMSKENGITFVLFIPLALWFFTPLNTGRIIRRSWPFWAIAALYLFIRWQVIGSGGEASQDIMNDPFLLASEGERLGTIAVIMLEYLRLLIWPHPMSFDYGYAHFPYYTLTHPLALLSMVLHLGLVALAVWKWKERSPVSFAIIFYLINIGLVSNILLPIGATMADRLLYLPSVGFVIALGWLAARGYSGLRNSRPSLALPIMAGAMLLLCVVSGFKVIDRNRDWKNNTTLFLSDIHSSPNSIKANNAAANELIMDFTVSNDTAELYEAMKYLLRADSLWPAGQLPRKKQQLYMVEYYLHQAYIHIVLREFDEAYVAWQRAYTLKPFADKVEEYALILGNYYFQQGLKAGDNRDFPQAIVMLEKAVKIQPKKDDFWTNLGGARYTAGDYAGALAAFESALKLNPQNQSAMQGRKAAQFQLQQSAGATTDNP